MQPTPPLAPTDNHTHRNFTPAAVALALAVASLSGAVIGEHAPDRPVAARGVPMGYMGGV